METRQEDRLIYLKDLLFVVLHRYKQILCAMLIMALLLGAGSAVKGIASLNDEEANAAAVAQYQVALADYHDQKAQLEVQLTRKEAEIKEHADYIEQSVFMNLDPYAHYEARLALGVYVSGTDESGKAVGILSAYQTLLTAKSVQEKMAQAVNVDVTEISRLLSVKQAGDASTVVVAVKYNNKEGTEALLRVFEEQLQNIEKQLMAQIGEHTLLVLESTVAQCADLNVAEMRNEEQAKLAVMQEEYAAIKQANAAQYAPVLQVNTAKTVMKRSILLAVVGAVVGAALIAVLAWIVHMFDGRIYSARVLRNQTGVKILGCLSSKKRSCLTQALCKIEGRDISDPENRAQVLAVDVRNRCSDIAMLLVTGDADAENRKTLLDALHAAMPGVKIIDKGSLLRDASAMEALAQCDAVLLVEQCGRSLYDNVREEIRTATDYSKTLLGCVLIGG